MKFIIRSELLLVISWKEWWGLRPIACRVSKVGVSAMARIQQEHLKDTQNYD